MKDLSSRRGVYSGFTTIMATLFGLLILNGLGAITSTTRAQLATNAEVPGINPNGVFLGKEEQYGNVINGGAHSFIYLTGNLPTILMYCLFAAVIMVSFTGFLNGSLTQIIMPNLAILVITAFTIDLLTDDMNYWLPRICAIAMLAFGLGTVVSQRAFIGWRQKVPDTPGNLGRDSQWIDGALEYSGAQLASEKDKYRHSADQAANTTDGMTDTGGNATN